MEQKVSVIVPIYKVEPYLKRAVASILHQTYHNLEIILVDDGSPDQCGRICDDYAKEDNRITVIHKENGGLSDARNAGLDAAHGEYIVFVDSDDFIAEDYVETLMQCLKKYDADVAMCSYAVTASVELDESIFKASRDETVEVCDRRELLNNLYDANHKDATYFIVSWNKIYKASLWQDVRFPRGRIHEDEATTYKIYDRAQKGVYLHRPLYGYFTAPSSITRDRFNIKRLQWMDALDDRIAYFEDKKDSLLKDEQNRSCLQNRESDSKEEQPVEDAGQKEAAQLNEEGKRETEFLEKQIACCKRARADASIHYYYPLKEELPTERKAAKRLKSYVWQEWKETKNPGYLIFSVSASLYRLITNIDRDKKERIFQLLCVCLFAWLAFLCFYKLDVKYVDPWDEARHGVNAYEMLKQGSLVKSTYLYQTDYYNLKPPLSMWSIMLSMVLFGKSVWTLRLASVICYLCLALCVVCFARKSYGRLPALFSLALLCSNTTPFIAHMVRAGDADSLYVLLFSLAMICMLQIRDDHRKLYLCGFLFALAFLTKSFHAGLIAVIGGLYLLLTGLFKKIRLKEYVFFILSFGAPIGFWVIARLCTDGTAFLKEMWLTDVLGRSRSGFGSNEAGFSYYFSYYLGNMSGKVPVYRVVLCLLLVSCLILAVMSFVQKHKTKHGADDNGTKSVKDDMIGFSLWILIPALAFSVVRTKLLWYEYPAITALLIVAGIAAGLVCEKKMLPVGIRVALGAVLLVTAGYYSHDLLQTFEQYGKDGYMTNDFQLLIEETANGAQMYGTEIKESAKKADETRANKEIEKTGKQGVTVYAYRALTTEDPEKPVDTQWAQQDVYVAEAYGDYICENDGWDHMLEDMKDGSEEDCRILFTTQELLEQYREGLADVSSDDAQKTTMVEGNADDWESRAENAGADVSENMQIIMNVLCQRGDYVSVQCQLQPIK